MLRVSFEVRNKAGKGGRNFQGTLREKMSLKLTVFDR